MEQCFTGDTSIDIHSPEPQLQRLDLTSGVNLVTGSSELSAEDIIDLCRKCMPKSSGVWEAVVLVNVSSSIWHINAIGC